MTAGKHERPVLIYYTTRQQCGYCGAVRRPYRVTIVANPKGIQNFSIPR
jgi:hypothetical protein